jgi:hypothetical protein
MTVSQESLRDTLPLWTITMAHRFLDEHPKALCDLRVRHYNACPALKTKNHVHCQCHPDYYLIDDKQRNIAQVLMRCGVERN